MFVILPDGGGDCLYVWDPSSFTSSHREPGGDEIPTVRRVTAPHVVRVGLRPVRALGEAEPVDVPRRHAAGGRRLLVAGVLVAADADAAQTVRKSVVAPRRETAARTRGPRPLPARCRHLDPAQPPANESGTSRGPPGLAPPSVPGREPRNVHERGATAPGDPRPDVDQSSVSINPIERPSVAPDRRSASFHRLSRTSTAARDEQRAIRLQHSQRHLSTAKA